MQWFRVISSSIAAPHVDGRGLWSLPRPQHKLNVSLVLPPITCFLIWWISALLSIKREAQTLPVLSLAHSKQVHWLSRLAILFDVTVTRQSGSSIKPEWRTLTETTKSFFLCFRPAPRVRSKHFLKSFQHFQYRCYRAIQLFASWSSMPVISATGWQCFWHRSEFGSIIWKRFDEFFQALPKPLSHSDRVQKLCPCLSN